MADHPEIDFYQLMYLTFIYYNIIGDTFWLIDRDLRTNKPNGIYLVPPSWMLLTPTMYIPYFRVQPMGNTSHRYFNADPSDIVWFKSPDASNPYGRGRGRSEAIGDEVETHEFSTKYAKNLFYNDAVPPIILEMPGISKPDADKFKETWMQKLGGVLNARKPGIVDKKDFKIHQLTTSPREMDFVESRKYLIQLANEHYCAPPELRGNIVNSNRATIDSALYLWMKRVITGQLRLFGAALNNQFVPMFDTNAYWKYDEVVPEDDAFQLEVLSRGVQLGVVRRNEWRLGMRLPADEKNGEVYLVPLGIIEQQAGGENAPEAEEAPEPVDAEESDEPAAAEEGIDLAAVVKELEAATVKLPVTVEQSKAERKAARRKAAWKAWDAKARKGEPAFSSAIREFAKKQKAQLATHLSGATDLAGVESALKATFNDRSSPALRHSLTPAWKASMTDGYEHAHQMLGLKAIKDVGPDWAVVNQRFTDWIKTNGLLRAEGINDTTQDALRNKISSSLAEGISAGEGRWQLSSRILDATDDVYDDMDRNRANMIARTETCASVNYGQVETYRADGVEKKEWLATQDDRTREDHIDADGQVVPIDEDFDIGGDKMSAPGLGNEPGENINCRCTILPVISSEEGE
jgi:SPP1 gp7 family putative phage head morphogenesis protein